MSKTLFEISRDIKFATETLNAARFDLLAAMQCDVHIERDRSELEEIVLRANDAKKQASEISRTAEGK